MHPDGECAGGVYNTGTLTLNNSSVSNNTAPGTLLSVYGGGINLIETGPMDSFQDGQLVRIEGRPADPDNKESEYRVNSIHALPNQ